MTGRGGNAGTIPGAGRSFEGLASRTGGGVRSCRGRRVVERQTGRQTLHLLGVERFTREKRIGHVEQVLLVLGR